MRLDANVQKVGAAGGGGYFFGGSPHGPGLQRALCAAPRFACCSPNKPASNQPSSPAAQQAEPVSQPASQPHRTKTPPAQHCREPKHINTRASAAAVALLRALHPVPEARYNSIDMPTLVLAYTSKRVRVGY